MTSVERHGNLGPLGCRRASVRILLPEITSMLGARPDRFVEPAVDGEPFVS